MASAAAAAAAAAAAQAAGSTNSGQARSSSSSFLIEDILFPRQKSQQLLEDNNASKATLSSNNGGKFCYIFLMIRDFWHFFITSSLKSYHFVSIRITYVAPLDIILKCLEHIRLILYVLKSTKISDFWNGTSRFRVANSAFLADFFVLGSTNSEGARLISK